MYIYIYMYRIYVYIYMYMYVVGYITISVAISSKPRLIGLKGVLEYTTHKSDLWFTIHNLYPSGNITICMAKSTN